MLAPKVNITEASVELGVSFWRVAVGVSEGAPRRPIGLRHAGWCARLGS